MGAVAAVAPAAGASVNPWRSPSPPPRPRRLDGQPRDRHHLHIPNTFDGLPLQLHEINSTLKSLKLTVLVKDSRGRRTKASVQIRSLHLPKN
jgi:hypothetical protein